jgi:hypothetical protein
MRPPHLTLTPLQASSIARAALAALADDRDHPILAAAHFAIVDRFDDGEAGYLVTVTTTNRYSLHHVTFSSPYAGANGPADFALPAAALEWMLTHANDFGNDARIMIDTDAGAYKVTILKGVRGSERMTRTGTIPKGTYPKVATLVTTAIAAATAPIDIHQYSASTFRSALAVVAAIAHDRAVVELKQTAQASGRPAGPLLITVWPAPESPWRILIQPQGITEGAHA